MIETLTGSNKSKIVKTYKDSAKQIIGYDISCESANNIFYGKVIFIGKDKNGRYSVNVSSNDNEIVVYGNIKKLSSSVTTGQYIKNEVSIGVTDKYIHLEYCTKWKSDSTSCVRIVNNRYYKQDPTDIINGDYEITPYVQINNSVQLTSSYTPYTDEQKLEFGEQRVRN